MIHLLKSLPWPLYLFFSIVVAIMVIAHFIKAYLRYSKFTVFGIILMGVSSVCIGILRILELQNIDERHYQVFKYLPLIGLLGLGLLFTGALEKSRDNPQTFKLVIITGGMMLFSVIVVLLVLLL